MPVAIFALAVALRVLAFSGFEGHDDGVYAGLAHELATDRFDQKEIAEAYVFRLRPGLLFPVAFLVRILGHTELAFIAYPFVVSLLGVFLGFAAGRLFFGWNEGLVCALVIAVVPLDVRTSSQLLPDLPAAFWAALAAVMLYAAHQQRTLGKQLVLAQLAGLALGLSWLCKESVIFLLPFLAGYIAWRVLRFGDLASLSFGGSAAAVWLIESLIYFHATGDFFHRLHVVERTYVDMGQWFFTEGSPYGWEEGNYKITLLRRLLWSGPITVFGTASYGYITLSAAVAVVYAVYRRLHAFVFPAIWFGSLTFMYNFASSSTVSYRPLALFDRYLYLLAFPAALLTAGLITALLLPNTGKTSEASREKSFWGILVVLGLGIACTSGIARFVREGVASPAERKFTSMYAPLDPVYTDGRTAGVLYFFWGYPPEMNAVDFDGMKAVDIPGNVNVLINRDRVRFLQRAYGYEAPEFFQQIPRWWDLQWRVRGAELYFVTPP